MARRRCTAVVVIAAVAASLGFARPVAATWPGANGVIAFGSYDPINGPARTADCNDDPLSYLSVVNPNGTHARTIIEAAKDPAYSGSGELAYLFVGGDCNGYTGYPSFSIRRMSGDGDHRITGFDTDRTGGPDGIAWDPSGANVAFGLASNVYTIDRDGLDGRRVLVAGGAPAWSVNGEIAFITRTGRLAVLADGQRRPMPALRATSADWSPDGSRIVFSRPSRWYTDLVVVRANGRGAHRIARTSGDSDASPVWSPDGKQIAFVGHGALYVMQARGSKPRRILRHASPPIAWQPLPRVAGHAAATTWQFHTVWPRRAEDGASVAVMPDGTLNFAWRVGATEEYSTDQTPDAAFSRRLTDGGLGPQTRLPFGDQPVDHVVVLPLADGSTVAAWSESFIDGGEVKLRRVGPDGKPARLLRVLEDDGGLLGVAHALGGGVTVIWESSVFEGDKWRTVVRARTVAADGSLGAVVDLSPPGPADEAELGTMTWAEAADGATTVVWTLVTRDDDGNQQWRIQGRTLHADGTTGPPLDIAPSSERLGPDEVTLGGGANTVVMWRESHPDHSDLLARWLRADGTMEPPIVVDTMSPPADEFETVSFDPSVATGSDGAATVVWNGYTPASTESRPLMARRLEPGSAPGPPTPISDFEGSGGAALAATGGTTGEMTVVWSHRGGVSARRLAPDGTLGPLIELARDENGSFGGALAFAWGDATVAIWREERGYEHFSLHERVIRGDQTAGPTAALSDPTKPAQLNVSVKPTGCVRSNAFLRARATVPPGTQLASLDVTVAGHTTRPSARSEIRLRVPASLLGRGRRRLTVTAVTADGVRTTASRRIQRCVSARR